MIFLTIGLAGTGTYFFYQLTQMVWIGRSLKAHAYSLFPDTTMWRIMLPSWIDIPWIVYGNNRSCKRKYLDFAEAGMDGYLQMALTQPACPTLFLADPQAIKEITRSRSSALQPVEMNRPVFGIFGPNVLTLEGETWKLHRKISQRAFTEKNTQLVWSETVLATEQLFRQWDSEQGREVRTSEITKIAEKLALMVISSAALGQRMSWNEEPNKDIPPGYSVSFRQALETVSRNIMIWVLIPSWAENLTQITRDTAIGFKDFGKYLRDMVSSHRNQGKLDQNVTGTKSIALAATDNLFSVVMKSSEENILEEGKGLADEEITGNVFLYLFAGHETTAHAIAFSLGLLAAYPEVQEEVYTQVKLTLGSRTSLEYTDLLQLKLVTGAFLEALRIYPVVPQGLKVAGEDFVLSVARNGPGTDESDRENIFVPAGSQIAISILAAHHNPRYWSEPEEFRPTRFCEAYNKDAFMAFSTGRRSCIGRRFAEIEGTAVLATILAQYEVCIDTSKFQSIPGEGAQARRERLLRPYHLITISPERLPLVFKRR